MALGFAYNRSPNSLNCTLAIVAAQKSSVGHVSPLLFTCAGYCLLPSIRLSPSTLFSGSLTHQHRLNGSLVSGEGMRLGEEWGQGVCSLLLPFQITVGCLLSKALLCTPSHIGY